MKCEICGSEHNEHYYKNEYSDEIICEDCLLELDGITTNTITDYYLDGEYIGNNAEIDELINNICDNCSYKELEGDK